MSVKRSDPYGFWSVSFERGSPPEFLKGQYTSFDEAFKDIQKYLLDRKEPEVPQRAVDVPDKKH